MKMTVKKARELGFALRLDMAESRRYYWIKRPVLLDALKKMGCSRYRTRQEALKALEEACGRGLVTL